MNAIDRLTCRMAELLIERLEVDARFPPHGNTRRGKESQQQADDLAALLIAARTETPEINDFLAYAERLQRELGVQGHKLTDAAALAVARKMHPPGKDRGFVPDLRLPESLVRRLPPWM